DPQLAANNFNWVIVAHPLNQAMLLGYDNPPTQAELHAHADEGVRVFLAAHRSR
ncbi:MAG: TetR/AcrR family transcriptional regulator C-terminal domain-containing protein, partial [Acidimicrobiales bacterium]